MELLESLAFGAGVSGVNQMLGQYNAAQAYERQKELMDKQYQYNQSLQKSSASNQVEGLRMAGLNPALAGSNPSSAQSVGLGSADMGQTFPVQAADMLALAQAENLQADTAKKQSEVPNIKSDTELKLAEKLKIGEDAQRIKNLNDSFATENRSLGEMGRAMAQKWQSCPWYNELAFDTRSTIDAIAVGELPLSVGAMAAFEKVVNAQKNMSDADRTLVRNAFDNALAEAQFNDKAIFNAIASMPEKESKLLSSQRDKIVEELPEIRQKVANLVSDLKTKKLTQEQMRAEIDSFKRNDLGFLKSKGEYGKWLEGYAEEALLRVLPLAAGGALAKPSVRSSGSKPSASSSPYSYREIERYPDGKIKRSVKSEGVGSFRY